MKEQSRKSKDRSSKKSGPFRTGRRNVRTQYGALCYRIKNQKLEILLVTSREQEAQVRSEAKSVSIERLSGQPHFIEPKHSLRTRHPKLAALELTEAQAIALNSWSYFGGAMPKVLTPEQLEELDR